MLGRVMMVVFSLAVTGRGGVLDIIRFEPSGSHGHLAVSAVASGVVSLRIEDSPALGGNLVSQEGIHFGEVNNLGTTQTPGVTGWPVGNVGHFESKFLLSAERSGDGRVTLHCQRSSAGNFNARNGIEIDDHQGVLKPLPAHFNQSVTVLSQASSGAYEKTIAINIYPQDRGVLHSVLKFTLCAL